MKIRKNERLTLIIYAAVFLLLMILGSFWDFQISKAMTSLKVGQYYSDNFFLRMTEIFGEIVIYGFLSVAILSIFLAAEDVFKNKDRVILTVKLVSAALAIFVNSFCVYKVMGYFFDIFGKEVISETFNNIVCFAVGGVMITLLWLSLLSSWKIEVLKKLCIWSLIVLLTVAISQALVQSIKLIFPRLRYRTLNAIEKFTYYKPWLTSSGLSSADKASLAATLNNDSIKSFPSGHTAAATCMFLLTALPPIFEKLQKKSIKIMLFSIAIIYTAFIAVARIAIGAHYLTDVTFSFGITIGAFWLARKIIFKKFKIQDSYTFEKLQFAELTKFNK